MVSKNTDGIKNPRSVSSTAVEYVLSEAKARNLMKLPLQSNLNALVHRVAQKMAMVIVRMARRRTGTSTYKKTSEDIIFYTLVSALLFALIS
ncbi:hypothetical protein V3C99_001126 [Haemonchus contortus]